MYNLNYNFFLSVNKVERALSRLIISKQCCVRIMLLSSDYSNNQFVYQTCLQWILEFSSHTHISTNGSTASLMRSKSAGYAIRGLVQIHHRWCSYQQPISYPWLIYEQDRFQSWSLSSSHNFATSSDNDVSEACWISCCVLQRVENFYAYTSNIFKIENIKKMTVIIETVFQITCNQFELYHWNIAHSV